MGPAITLRLFRETYLPAIGNGMIRRFTLFTLDDQTEQADHCAKIYNKSLLYLVSNALEETGRGPRGETGEPLLGMERCLREDGADILDLVARGRIEWVVAPSDGAVIESEAEAHGAFDELAYRGSRSGSCHRSFCSGSSVRPSAAWLP